MGNVAAIQTGEDGGLGQDGSRAGVHDVDMVQDRHSIDGLDGAYSTHCALVQVNLAYFSSHPILPSSLPPSQSIMEESGGKK